MKKIFGGINLTWKKLIVFSIIAGIYTAIMAILPITDNTSFRDIAINLDCWIVLGIIIIMNSRSAKDSALKCFIFFLISQPLIYLIQVPFSWQGWGLFRYYKTWFIWTLATLPMGYIGYYINKKNIISVIILLPMLMLLSYYGLGYFSAAISSFPYHLLSAIFCFVSIILIVFNLFDKTKYKIISLGAVLAFSVIFLFLKGGMLDGEFEVYRTLDNYNIVGNVEVTTFSGTAQGNVEIISSDDALHSIKLIGRKNGKYTFTLTDQNNKDYNFEYYYDKDQNTVILNKVE